MYGRQSPPLCGKVHQLAVEVLTLRGLVTYYVLFFIQLESREVDIAGIPVHPNEQWMQQMARNVTMEGYRKYLTAEAVAHYVGKRFADGDQANVGASMIPAYTVVDLRLGGEADRFFWSLSVQNLFNKSYYDYALDQSFPGFPFVSIYPLPGRAVTLRAGATF